MEGKIDGVCGKRFSVGHSAEAKTSKRKKELWESFTKRAILDLMILKESDYLIYSQKSSFGKFARELQMAYANPVDVDPFFERAGIAVQCLFQPFICRVVDVFVILLI